LKLFLLFCTLFTVAYCAAQTAANYNTHIKPLLQTHCMPCHNGNNIGTMPLTDYKNVSAYAKMIGYVTQNKIMPPWKAEQGYNHIKNTSTLNTAEINLIKNWIDSGLIQGKPPAKQNVSATNKTISINKPDVVFAMQKPFAQKENFTERAQVFVIPVNINEDVFAEAIEFVPGNKRIVKSCSISIDTSGKAAQYDSYDLNYGYYSPVGLNFIPYQYNWYQWTADMQGATFYNKPYLKKIPANSHIVLHIFYAASVAAQKDSSYVKIKLYKKQDSSKFINSRILFTPNTITNGPFVINADEKRNFYATVSLQKPIEIHSIMPMGQNACTSWEIYAIDSVTGRRIDILNIPRWDGHWRKKYDFSMPIQLTKGSKIFAVTSYNNSEGNASLTILPAKKIIYGEGERDEMFLVQYDVVELAE
jgi:hypothetical protein